MPQTIATSVPRRRLRHGPDIPALGLGTWQLEGRECLETVRHALTMGYRHLDTAETYGNEEQVGRALADAEVDAGDVFVTTKVWHENLAPDALRRAFDASLGKLGLDHVDLYLIHWPSPEMDLAATLEAMIELRDQRLTRAIGVANFPVALMRKAVDEIGAPIACNQVEYHVLRDQTALLTYLRAKNIPLVAYCPLAQGRLADHPELDRIAAKHGVTAAQVALKWLLDQDGVAAIPKSSRRQGQQANLDALRVSLDDEDRKTIAALPKNERFVDPAFAPAWDPPDT